MKTEGRKNRDSSLFLFISSPAISVIDCKQCGYVINAMQKNRELSLFFVSLPTGDVLGFLCIYNYTLFAVIRPVLAECAKILPPILSNLTKIPLPRQNDRGRMPKRVEIRGKVATMPCDEEQRAPIGAVFQRAGRRPGLAIFLLSVYVRSGLSGQPPASTPGRRPRRSFATRSKV